MQKRLFLLAIALVILLPATGVVTGLGAMSAHEMQTFEARKKAEFRTDFPKWFADRLGMRRLFLRTYSGILFSLFGQPTNPDRAQVGQNNFLFLGDIYETSFSAHSGIPLLGKDELLHLGEGFKYLITRFQERGIPVLLAIAPDKDTIYAEYYPTWVKHVVRAFPQDNFINSPLLKKHTLFLEDSLLNYKDKTDYLYWKNETHWNQLGAFLGYTTIMDSLEKLLGKDLERIRLLGWKTGDSLAKSTGLGDLAKLNLGATEDEFSIDLLTTNELHTDPSHNGDFLHFNNESAPNKLNIAIIYDSFYNLIPDVYRKTFSSIHEIHFNTFIQEKNLDTLLAEKPPLDLVLILIVERTIPIRDSWLQKLVGKLSPSPG